MQKHTSKAVLESKQNNFASKSMSDKQSLTSPKAKFWSIKIIKMFQLTTWNLASVDWLWNKHSRLLQSVFHIKTLLL